MITGRNVKSRAVANRDIDTDAPKNGYVCEDFKGPFVMALQGGGAAVGTTGGTNLLIFGHNIFNQFILGAGQTVFNPPLIAGGLDISGDQVVAEGFEYSGGMDVRQESVFTIGTHGPFSLEVELAIADASGANPLVIGFRKLQAGQTALATYTDIAVVGIIGTTAQIQTQTDNDSAGDVITDTGLTWADGATKKLKVTVEGSGKAKFYVAGVQVNTYLSPVFDATDQVAPFLYFLHAADVAGIVTLSSWKCGLDQE